MTVEFPLLLVIAYLLGSIPTAYLVAKWRRGIDIRRFGSGNVGLSNAVASGSRWTIFIVISIDFLKGAVPVYLAGSYVLDLLLYQQIIIGLATICGHNWPIYLRFSGGRGVLTTLGVLFPFVPWLAITALAVNCIFLPFHQFALGTFLVLVILPLLSWFTSSLFRIEQSIILTLGIAAISLLLFVRRLTAPRTEFSSSVATGELMLNRLLLDRDIKDRKKWLSRKPPEMMSKDKTGGDKSK